MPLLSKQKILLRQIGEKGAENAGQAPCTTTQIDDVVSRLETQ